MKYLLDGGPGNGHMVDLGRRPDNLERLIVPECSAAVVRAEGPGPIWWRELHYQYSGACFFFVEAGPWRVLE